MPWQAQYKSWASAGTVWKKDRESFFKDQRSKLNYVGYVKLFCSVLNINNVSVKCKVQHPPPPPGPIHRTEFICKLMADTRKGMEQGVLFTSQQVKITRVLMFSFVKWDSSLFSFYTFELQDSRRVWSLKEVFCFCIASRKGLLIHRITLLFYWYSKYGASTTVGW